MTQITIDKCENGYIMKEIIRWNLDGGDEQEEHKTQVVEEISTDYEREKYKTDDESLIAIGKLLELVADSLGVRHDKYGKENLVITFNGLGRKVTEEDIVETCREVRDGEINKILDI